MIYFKDENLKVINADVLDGLSMLENESVQCVVTSPPYWGLRDYGEEGQIGLEKTPDEYVSRLIDVFREVRRVLRDDGTLWLNLGDSYAGSWGDSGNRPERTGIPGHQRERTTNYLKREGHAGDLKARVPSLKPKDLIGIPWRMAFALQADGWYLRSDIIWSKPNPMPESITDRPTKSHEYIFLITKTSRYYFDQDAVREENVNPDSIARYERGRSDDHKWANGGPGNQTCAKSFDHMIGKSGRNIRSVWTIATQPYSEAHFATFPKKLVEPCVKAGCPEGGTVLDPFAGSGTVGLVANNLNRRAMLIELKEEYCQMIMKRCQQKTLL